MLVVTNHQLELIGYQRWEDEILEEMMRFAPRLYEIRGETIFREFIREGYARAEGHGFTNRGPVRFFIQTMASLGHHFDEDPQLTPIRVAIGDPQRPQKQRAQDAFAAVLDYFDRVPGSDATRAIAALARLRDNNELWNEAPPPSRRLLVESMLAHMHGMFPAKAEYAGDSVLEQLVDAAMEHAATHELDAMAGGRIIAALMFALGWGITTDPLYPWVALMLEHREQTPRYDRIHHLAAKTRIYLDATLSYLEGGQ
ncbi:MAG: hypothetical protein AAGF11_13125 [Myxococcota bacterium]